MTSRASPAWPSGKGLWPRLPGHGDMQQFDPASGRRSPAAHGSPRLPVWHFEAVEFWSACSEDEKVCGHFPA